MNLIALCSALFLLLASPPAAPAAERAAGGPELLPDLVLKVPEDPDHRAYLGLTGENGSDFSIQDIDADIVLIELFNMYCHYCQEAAPAVNELHDRMREVSRNGPVVKIIGLGVSNSRFEVEHFGEMYDVAFPLFPDQDSTFFQALSGEGTPTFIGCRLKDRERPVIVLRQAGAFADTRTFLQELLDKGRP